MENLDKKMLTAAFDGDLALSKNWLARGQI